MRLMVLDVETTGVDPDCDSIIEIGAALYDVPAQTVIWQYGAIVPTTVKNAAQETNGITPRALRSAAQLYEDTDDCPTDPVLDLLRRDRPRALVAHTADFDSAFLAQWAPEFDPEAEAYLDIPWVCSQMDLVFPAYTSSRRLTHLAADHGIPIGVTHRALADVLLVCELLKQTYSLEAQVERALKPKGMFAALISYEDRQLAKDAGFAWDGARKVWWKNYPLDEVVLSATDDRPFDIRPL